MNKSRGARGTAAEHEVIRRIEMKLKTYFQFLAATVSLSLTCAGPDGRVGSNIGTEHGQSADCVVVVGRLADLIAAQTGNGRATMVADLITAELDTLHFVYPETVHCNPGTFESIPGFKPGGLMRIYVKRQDLEAARYQYVTVERAADCATQE